MTDNAAQFALSIFAANLLAALVSSGALTREDGLTLAAEMRDEVVKHEGGKKIARYFGNIIPDLENMPVEPGAWLKIDAEVAR